MLEIDINPNPLRSLLAGGLVDIAQGRANLGHLPGLGVVPDLRQLADAAAQGC